ncbi:uncharacterized protein LOC108668009 [Hyalella azteca]|uniref:Regulatory protein zeste n=1 Tax=Hyalella azteca TaxID=294128 RepID=A0A8B7NAL5_HYAAZ|nr:uncharacterized protein LOC108668009 [Hyalella azteca]
MADIELKTDTEIDNDNQSDHCDMPYYGNVPTPSGSNHESEEDGFDYAGELPLEVITTVTKDVSTPVLKVKSNGVLTHRNIFTDSERAILKDIVLNYHEIVDTRSRSRDTFLEKQNAWEKIVLEYNEKPNMQPRTVKELRKCWDNMKYRARQAEKELQQKSVEEGYYQMLTGSAHGDLNTINDSEVINSLDVGSGVSVGVVNPSVSLCSSDGVLTSSGEESDPSQPVSKKARSDAPKLSSLLLGNNISAKVNGVKENTAELSYRGDNEPCIAVESDYDISSSTSAAKSRDVNLNGFNTHAILAADILPKIIPPGVSVTRIPSSKGLPTTFNLGSGMTITSQTSNASPVLKAMPSLKKINNKIGTSRKFRSKNLNLPPRLDQEEISFSSYDANDDIQCKELHARLLSKRIEYEQAEHIMRMKMLEKQMNVYSQQANYWSLKLRLLKANKDTQDHMYVNGESYI